MKRFCFLLTALATLAACSQVQPPGQSPVADAGTSLEPQTLGTAADDIGKELAISSRIGAIYVAGITKGSLDFPNQGGNDIYIRRYKQNKTIVWKRQIASSANDIVKDIAADPSGQLYVAGLQGNTCFHSKYAANGRLLWKHTFSSCSSEVMAVDTVGNIYWSRSHERYSDVSELYKYNSRGKQVYSTVIGSGYGDESIIETIAFDGSGYAYVSVAEAEYYFYNWSYIQKVSPTGASLPGFFSATYSADIRLRDMEIVGNTLYVGGYEDLYGPPDESGENESAPYLGSDIYVAKYNVFGTLSWQRTFGTGARDIGTTITADTAGNVYVVGVTRGNLAARNAGGDDIVARKLSVSGSTLWTKQFGSASFDQVDDVIAYSSSELYLTGTTLGALESGTHHGRKDAFLLRRNGSGNKVWTDQ